MKVAVLGGFSKLARAVDLDDQVEACRRVFASDTRWIVVRGSKLEEGQSQGLPVWSRHVGDPILASNITRRVDFSIRILATNRYQPSGQQSQVSPLSGEPGCCRSPGKGDEG